MYVVAVAIANYILSLCIIMLCMLNIFKVITYCTPHPLVRFNALILYHTKLPAIIIIVHAVY